MKPYQTKVSLVNAKQPTELDQLRILNRRKVDFSEDNQYQLIRLEAGLLGEETVIHYLKEYGREDWLVLRNVWLNDYGLSECDILLITGCCIYAIEDKNYTGSFVYTDGKCSINGRNNKNNCIAQARKAYLNVRDIVQKFSYGIQVEGALVFVGVDNMVDIQSPVEDIQIVLRNQLRHFIQKIAVQEQVHAFLPLNKEKIIAHLEKYEVSNPYLPKPLPLDEMTNLRRGIYCAHCHSYTVTVIM